MQTVRFFVIEASELLLAHCISIVKAMESKHLVYVQNNLNILNELRAKEPESNKSFDEICQDP